jgi:hypothetical protein
MMAALGRRGAMYDYPRWQGTVADRMGSPREGVQYDGLFSRIR